MKLFLALFINNYIETVNKDKVLKEIEVDDSDSDSSSDIEDEYSFRNKIKKMIKSSRFENFLLVIIVISCIFMALDEPLEDPHS